MPLSVFRGQQAPGGRWTEHDRSLAVALTWHEAMLCPGCGQPVEESTSAEADPLNRGGAWHYDVPDPHRCHACTAVTAKQDEMAEKGTPYAPHALRYSAVRVDDPPTGGDQP